MTDHFYKHSSSLEIQEKISRFETMIFVLCVYTEYDKGMGFLASDWWQHCSIHRGSNYHPVIKPHRYVEL